MAGSTPAIGAGIGPNGGLETLVAEQLPDRFEAAGLGVELDFCAQMAELVCGEHDPGSLLQICRDQPRNRSL